MARNLLGLGEGDEGQVITIERNEKVSKAASAVIFVLRTFLPVFEE